MVSRTGGGRKLPSVREMIEYGSMCRMIGTSLAEVCCAGSRRGGQGYRKTHGRPGWGMGVDMKGMRGRKRFRGSKYLIKLFYCFLSLLLLMYMAMAVVYVLASRNTREAVFDKIRSNLTASAQLIDSHMGVVQNVGLSLYNTKVMQSYFKYDARLDMKVWAEQYQITNVIQQNEAIFGGQITLLYAFFVDSDRIYTSAGVYDKDFFFQNICVYAYGELTTDSIRRLYSDAKTIEVLPVGMTRVRNNPSEEMIAVVTHLRVEGREAMIVAHVPASQLVDMQKGTALTSDSVFMIYDRENQCILNTREGIIHEQSPGDYLQARDGDRVNGMYVFCHKSDRSGWKYVSLVPVEGVARLTNLYMIYILLAGMLLTIAGVAFAFFLSVRLYRPIGSIVNEISPPQTEENRRDEMKLLHRGVLDLLEKEEQYRIQFQSYRERYIEHALQLLVNGISWQHTQELQEKLREHCRFKGSRYVCASVFFDFTELFFREYAGSDRDKAYRMLQEILQTLLEGRVGIYVLMCQGGIYPCLIDCKEEDPADHVRDIFLELKQVFQVDAAYYKVSVGISHPFGELKVLQEAYGQTLQAIRYCTGEDCFGISVYRSQGRKAEVAFSFYDQKKIVSSIRLGKREQLFTVLDEVLDMNNIRGISQLNRTELYRQLFSVGQRCLEDCEGKTEELESETRLGLELQQENKVLECNKARELITAYFEEIYELANHKESQNSSQQIELIQKYIRENYREDLSLDGISDVFGLSSKYLSRLFKQKTGINLTEYVNMVRVGQAKELLQNTQIKIGDIYSMVGIDSRATFLRVFKKLEGYSPSEYRELSLGQKERSLRKNV